MGKDLDPFLENFFAEAERPLEEQAFMQDLLAELQRLERARTRRRMVVAVAAVMAAFVVMPTVLEQTASLVRLMVYWMDYAPASVCWTASTFIGICVILRTSRLGRR